MDITTENSQVFASSKEGVRCSHHLVGYSMIVDSFANYRHYETFSKDLYCGICFIRNLADDIEFGKYVVNERAFAIVEEYWTSLNQEPRFEAHRKYYDIQYALLGSERIYWESLERVYPTMPYSPESDVAFFSSDRSDQRYCDIGNGIFAVMFPGDAHSPKNASLNSELIKKVTVKVLLDEKL